MPKSIIDAMRIMPTALSSAELRALEAGVKERAFFSARVTSAGYLQSLRERITEIAAGRLSPQAARAELRQELARLGYTPEGGFPGGAAVPPADADSLQDLSSGLRLNLQIDTVLGQGAALRQKAESQSEYMMREHPGWRFVRVGARGMPRDWPERWQAAGDACGWEGASNLEMVALKDSPIWQELGNGAGGYDDTLGNDFPPFAFNSGMEWRNVDRAACVALGLIGAEETAEPPEQNYEPSSREVTGALARMDPDMRAKLKEALENW